MGITMNTMGRSGKPGRFFFIPKGALTHHRAAGQAVVSLPAVGLVRSSRSAHRALLQRGQPMPQNVSSASAVRLADGYRPLCTLAAKPCPCPGQSATRLRKPATAQGTPFGCGSFIAEMDDAFQHRPFSFACAKRNKNASLREAERT